MADAAMDTISEITTKDLKKKKKVIEKVENGREAPVDKKNGEQVADNKVYEEGREEEDYGEEKDGDEDEEAKAATRKWSAEDDEDDVDTKKQKMDEDDYIAKKGSC
uniref:prothymosin alpha-like n=1 Tax=Jaculus jaculus TaxID=51337 RepID=UPI0003334A47|nr:prothymosin alpha-like [Jaculus jaculus]